MNAGLCIYTLSKRELVRFFRQRNRVMGALVQPLMFWLLFGAGFGASFRPAGAPDGTSYREFFFPGTVALVVLFTSIFSTFSLIEDRKEGFLQSVLVAPVSRTALVIGKLLGGTLLAALQGALFLTLAPTQGISLDPIKIAALLGVLLVLSFGLTGLGFAMAWRMDSTSGFHAVMSVILLPMWVLSGAFFPAANAPGWLYWIIQVNPLSHGVALIRHALYMDLSKSSADGIPGPEIAIVVLCGFALLTFLASWRMAAVRTSGDLL